MLSAAGKRLTILVTLATAALTASAIATEATAPHGWTAAERGLMQGLSLRGLAPHRDPSNRVAGDPAAARLGHRIFFDKRFSADGTIACASCHKPEFYFTDGRETGIGLGETTRNTPTIVGSSRNTWFFHDGRADSLWSQALAPLENPLEHGGSRSQYAHLVFADPLLRADYERAFGPMPDISDAGRFPRRGGPLASGPERDAWYALSPADREVVSEIFVNIGKAIAAYESQLQPGLSRFDRYVEAVLNDDAQRMEQSYSADEAGGLRIFVGKGNCLICHNGPMLTNYEFNNIAVPPRTGKQFDWGRYLGAQQVLENPFNCRSPYNDSGDRECPDLKYMVMEKHETLGSIKTPSLRNVARTAPYMHAGQYRTLREVLDHYNDPPSLNYRQSDLFLDISLSESELDRLEAFLRTLDSDIDADPHWLTAPR